MTIVTLWIHYCSVVIAVVTPWRIFACQMVADISFEFQMTDARNFTLYHFRLRCQNHKIYCVLRVQRQYFFVKWCHFAIFFFTNCFRRRVPSFVALFATPFGRSRFFVFFFVSRIICWAPQNGNVNNILLLFVHMYEIRRRRGKRRKRERSACLDVGRFGG